MTNPYQRPNNYQQPFGTNGYDAATGQMQHLPAQLLKPKSKVVAALLAFFLGSLGAHNFYLGYTAKGAIQAGLTIFGWITLIFVIGFFVLAAAGIWALVELIMIIADAGPYQTDASGVPLD